MSSGHMKPLSPGARSLLRLLRNGATLRLSRSVTDPWGLLDVTLTTRQGKPTRLDHAHAWITELLRAHLIREEPEDSGVWVMSEGTEREVEARSPVVTAPPRERRGGPPPPALPDPPAPPEPQIVTCPACGRPGAYSWHSWGSSYAHPEGDVCEVKRPTDPTWGLGKG